MFKELHTKVLNIEKDSTILLIYDEGFVKYLKDFIDETMAISPNLSLLYLPKCMQEKLVKNIDSQGEIILPVGLGIIFEMDIVVNCLYGESGTLPLRKAIISQARNSTCKFAHMTGITDEFLKTLEKTDFEEVKHYAKKVAWALGQSTKAKIITSGNNGQEYALELELGDWKNEPFISNGIIEKGNWGNPMPGEAFCCPLENSANGEICINGSLPEYPINSKSEIILKFKKGRLINWECISGDESFLEFFESLKSRSVANNDPDWNQLSELGIGLNSAIRQLTGFQLVDEKKLGTIHIAIGDNTIFGHKIVSKNHYDLVTLNPTLILDKYRIIEKGTLNPTVIELWKKEVTETLLSNGPILNSYKYEINETSIEIKNNILFRRIKNMGRVSLIEILDGYNFSGITENNGNLSFEKLCENLNNHIGLFKLLNHYDIIYKKSE